MSLRNKEPIRTFSRSAIQHKTSLYANLPVLAREKLEIEAKDAISVEVYHDEVVIKVDRDE